MRRLLVALILFASCDDCTTDKSGGPTCCKVCKSGSSKPCGDSCIATNQTCSKGAGCACYGVAHDTFTVPPEFDVLID